MMRRLRGLGLALGLSCVVAVAWAQEEEAPRPVPASATAKKDDNLVRVNGRPTVLLWANGLDAAEDLEAYVETGFNTAAITISDVSEEALAKVFELASAAEERGLLVLGVLAPEGFEDGEGNQLPVDPLLPAYVEAAQSFAQKAVAALDRHPRLIGWVVGGAPPDQVVWGDNGFQSFLRRAYPSVAALNNSWGTEYEDFAGVTTGAVGDVDSVRPGGIGRARVDFAAYRARTYADAVGVWTQALRGADARRLIFVGGVTDYRSSISLHTGFDGLIAASTPSAAEADTTTGNVHGVDIARRANQFIAIQTLDVTGSAAPSQLGNWISLALLHGASGIQVWSWGALKESEDLAATVKQAAAALEETRGFPLKPVARAAVLYEPFAGGEMRYGKSLYGYLDGVTEKEPTDLFFTVKNGSRYGLMDVLSLESLGAIDLRQYGAIFAPMALYLPDEAQAALNQFVLLGGALVADAGVGMYQAKGTVDSIPEIMLTTFGMREGQSPSAGSQPEPEPTPGMTFKGVRPNQPGRNTLQSPEEELEGMLQELEELLYQPEVSKFLGQQFSSDEAPELRVRGLGKGFSVYAPAFLYQQWDPERADFADFHDHVLSWAYDVNVAEPEALWPPVAVASYTNKTVAVAAPNGSASAVDLYFVGNQLYQVPGGLTKLWNTAAGSSVELIFPGARLAAGVALPITVLPTEEDTTVTVGVLQYDADGIKLVVNGNGATVGVAGGEAYARGGDSTPAEITIGGGDFRVTPGESYRVVIDDPRRVQSDYEVMPNSETGEIVISNLFRNATVTIAPAEASPDSDSESESQ
jgi:hypothetical protein